MDERSDQELPGSVSDQNREQAEPGHGGGEPRRGSEDTEHGRAKRERRPGDPGPGGEAGEGSQSTGDPRSAG